MTKLFLDGLLEVSALDDSAVFGDAGCIVVFPWKSAIEAAQALLAENHRRQAEAAMQPKRWYVHRSSGGWVAELALSQDCNDGNMGVAGGQMTHAWLWAKGEKEAITKARELAVSVYVLTQEYLRP